MLSNSLWDWELGLQREGCCKVMGLHAVKSLVGECRCVNNSLWGWELGPQREGRCIKMGLRVVKTLLVLYDSDAGL